jgi:hypothetical protein
MEEEKVDAEVYYIGKPVAWIIPAHVMEVI